jgi:uncharacterized protein
MHEIVKPRFTANGVEMKILIAGGTGFLGGALAKSFLVDKHPVYILTRDPKVSFPDAQVIPWDGKTTTGWGNLVNEMDVVIHIAGKSLASWPWTAQTKRSFIESRVRAFLSSNRALTIMDYTVTLLTNPRPLEMIFFPN